MTWPSSFELLDDHEEQHPYVVSNVVSHLALLARVRHDDHLNLRGRHMILRLAITSIGLHSSHIVNCISTASGM